MSSGIGGRSLSERIPRLKRPSFKSMRSLPDIKRRLPKGVSRENLKKILPFLKRLKKDKSLNEAEKRSLQNIIDQVSKSTPLYIAASELKDDEVKQGMPHSNFLQSILEAIQFISSKEKEEIFHDAVEEKEKRGEFYFDCFSDENDISSFQEEYQRRVQEYSTLTAKTGRDIGDTLRENFLISGGTHRDFDSDVVLQIKDAFRTLPAFSASVFLHGEKIMFPSKDDALELYDGAHEKKKIEALYDKIFFENTDDYSVNGPKECPEIYHALKDSLDRYEDKAKEAFGSLFETLQGRKTDQIIDGFINLAPEDKKESFANICKMIVSVLPNDYKMMGLEAAIGKSVQDSRGLKHLARPYAVMRSKRFNYKIDHLVDNEDKIFSNLAQMIRLRDAIQHNDEMSSEEKKKFSSIAKKHFYEKFKDVDVPKKKSLENKTNIHNYFLSRFSDDKFLKEFCDFLNLVMPQERAN